MRIALVTGTRTDERQGVVTSALVEYRPDIVLVGDASGVDAEARFACRASGFDHVTAEALWDKYGKPAGPRRNDLMAFLAAAVAHYTASAPVVFAVPGANSRGTYDCADRACPAMGLTSVEWL